MNAWPDSLALVLTHTLWTGSLAAAAVALLLRRIGTDRPDLRSGVAYAGMVLTLVGALAFTITPTLAVFDSAPGSAGGLEPAGGPTLRSDPPAEPGADSDGSAVDKRPEESAAALLERATSRPALQEPLADPSEGVSWRRLVVGVWLVGVAVMLLSVGRSHAAARGLVRRATGKPSPELVRLLDLVADKFRLARRATIRLSDEVRSPLIYGIVSPAVLIPTSLATGAPTDTLCAVLAHELWHLRRGDLLWGVGQRLLESLLFYHPAIWWMSRQVDREREAACDAAAARVFGRGKPVAAALVDVAEWSLAPPVAGFAMGRGFLPERVQRLLNPGARAAPRVSWGGLLSLAAFGAASLAVFAVGTRMVAREVAALTPTERVEAIVQAITANEPEFSPKIDPKTGLPVEDVPVTGRLVVPDGEALPRYPGVDLLWTGMNKGISCESDGRFEANVPAGVTFFVHPSTRGFVQSEFGPFKVGTEPFDVGDLELDPGFDGLLVMRDKSGQPLPDVTVSDATYWRWFGGSGSGSGHPACEGLTSDEQGALTLPAMCDREITLTLEKPGYQRLKKEVTFKPGKPVSLTLKPSKPTTGRFVDAEGQPVAGVEIHCVFANGDSLGGNDPRQGYVERLDGRSQSKHPIPITVSGEDGLFELSSLRSGADYWLIVLHPDHAPTRLDDVKAGQDLGTTLLPPPLEVRGRIVGDLAKHANCRQVSCSNSLIYRLDGHSHGYSRSFYCPVDEEGRFTCRQLMPGRVRLYVAKHWVDREITESIDDLVIDLDELAERNKPPMRDVRLWVKPTGGQPIRGEVGVSWSFQGNQQYAAQSSGEQRFAISEGKPCVEFQAPIGAKLWFRGDWLVGSHAKDQWLLQVPAGEGFYETSVEADPAGLVVGRLVDARGEPITSGSLDVRNDENNLGHHVWKQHNRVNEEGGFSIGGLPLGDDRKYLCEVSLSGLRNVADCRRYISKPFRLTEEKPIHARVIKFPDPVYLTGRVVNHRGEPTPGRSFRVSANHWGAGGYRLDENSRFRVAINPEYDTDYYRITIEHGDGSTGRSVIHKPGWFGGGKDFGELRLDAGTTVRGRLTLPDGSPATGVRVTLHPADDDNAAYYTYLEVKTDENGEYLFNGVERVPQKIDPESFRREVISVDPASCRADPKYGGPIFTVDPSQGEAEVNFVVSERR